MFGSGPFFELFSPKKEKKRRGEKRREGRGEEGKTDTPQGYCELDCRPLQ